MVGGTTPSQSDSGEISRVLVLNLLWQSKRCSRTAEEIFVLDNAFALIDGQPQLWWSQEHSNAGWASLKCPRLLYQSQCKFSVDDSAGMRSGAGDGV